MSIYYKNSKVMAVVLLIVLTISGCGGSGERKAKYLERGKAFFEEENYNKATVEFKNVLQIDPKSADAYYYLARLAEMDKQWSLAFANYSKAVELDPEHIEARLRLGYFYVYSDALEDAAKQVEEVLRREESNADALTLRATILKKEGKNEDSMQLLQQILKSEPGHERAALTLASILNKLGKTDEEIQVLEAATAASVNNIDIAVQLARVYLKNEESAKAESLLEGLVKDFPGDMTHRIRLAEYYSATGQNNKAERVLRDAMTADPEDDRIYLMFADVIANKSGIDSAIEALNKIISEKPNLTKIRSGLARLYVRSGDKELAETTYQAIIEKDGIGPDGLAARTSLAILNYKDGEMDNAKLLIAEVLKDNPKDNQALLLKGRIALDEESYPEAIGAFRTVLKSQPDSAEVMTLLAGAHEGNGEHELAIDNLYRVVELYPDDVEGLIRLGTYLAQRDKMDVALAQIDQALEHINKALVDAVKTDEAIKNKREALSVKVGILDNLGRAKELEAALTELEEVSPESGLGSLGKARLYMSQNNYAKARKSYENVLVRDPGSELALRGLVNVEIMLGEQNTAIERLVKMLADNPDNPVVHELLGVSYAAKNDYAKAETEFIKQLEINNKASTIYTHLAAVRTRQGNIKGAIQALQQGLTVLPDDARLFSGLAEIYASQGDYENATKFYRQGLLAAPDNVNIAISLASVMEQQGKVDDAIAVYERFLASNPDSIVAINNLASMLIEVRDDKASLDKAKELAVKLAGTDQPVLLDTLGWVYYHLGEFKDATATLSYVVKKEPEIPVFKYHLGMSYYKQGDIGAAKDVLARAIADEYEYDGVEEARRVYNEIKGK